MSRSLSYLALAVVGVQILTGGAAAAQDAPETVVPAHRLDTDWWKQRHEAVKQRAAQGGVDLLFLGDSITQGWNDNEVWKRHFAPRNALNAGFSGDRTQHVLWRLDNGEIDGIQPRLAVLMIGTNNSGADTSEDIAAGIEAIVKKLQDKLPETKILILGVFPRGQTPDDAKRKVNEGANEIVKQLANGDTVEYLDIGAAFVEPDGTLSKEVMPDFLHLSADGYRRWAEAIDAKVAEMMGEPAAAK